MLPPLPTLLQSLVRRPSVNPMGRAELSADILYEARVADYLEELLQQLPVRVERQPAAPGRDNIVAYYTHPTATRTLIFQAHTDTVPVDGMTVPPFGGEIRGGKLFGRGACDVKAGAAAVLTAFARVVDAKISVNLTAAFTVDEEHTFLGIDRFAKTAAADFAVVSEPTSLDLVTAHKGVCRWRLTTRGRACHSSRPQDGTNAIYAMAKLLRVIDDYAAALPASAIHASLGGPTLSAGRIDGGTSANTVPDFCGVDLDRRLLPTETAAVAEAHLRAALAAAGVPFDLARVFDGPALAATDAPELANLETAVRAVTSRTPRRLAVPYATDAGTLAAAGIPCAVFGPGAIAQAHTADEWVDLNEVEAAAETLFRFATG